MKSISEKIADIYIQKNIIDESKKDIYIYGLSLIINDIIIFSAIIILSMIVSNFISAVIFITTFYAIRIRSGGFHAKKTWICKMTMIITFLSIICVYRLTDDFGVIYIIALDIISFMTLIAVMPVENPNKKLTEKQIKDNREKGIITILIFSIISIITMIAGFKESIIISLTMLSVAMLAVLGKQINNIPGHAPKNPCDECNISEYGGKED